MTRQLATLLSGKSSEETSPQSSVKSAKAQFYGIEMKFDLNNHSVQKWGK